MSAPAAEGGRGREGTWGKRVDGDAEVAEGTAVHFDTIGLPSDPTAVSCARRECEK